LSNIEERLRALTPEVLKGIRRGIEKESLRVRPDGRLAGTPHPYGLGSALTHPHITTDFSESQLELITGVHTDVDACLRELEQIHQVVYREIGEEMLWCASMPCGLPQDDAIPIGQYGSSNVGRMKTVYRIGLSHRYGRRMQTISGIHYNFSLPEAAWPALQRLDRRGCASGVYRNDAYFALIRNFRRHSWLVMLLFGASPAVCSTFVDGRAHGLQKLASGTLYLPHATSLRMGPLGYQSDAQASLAVSYNSLRTYAGSLYGALTEPYPPYEAIGIRDGDDYRQLSTALLQIENEFYGTIRPKRRIKPGERPLHALGDRGVEYVEVRLIDLDPHYPIGIAAGTVRFLDIYLLYCLLSGSPPDNPGEIADINDNRTLVAQSGRDPAARLSWRGDEISIVEWGEQLLGECLPIARALDDAHGGNAYAEALSAAHAALRNSASVPSAQVLAGMKERHADSFVQFSLAQSVRHREHFLRAPLAREVAARFSAWAEESRETQRNIEAGDSVPFETYRQQYLSQDLLGGVYLRPQP
jgi:glutamate--cysteine ligase